MRPTHLLLILLCPLAGCSAGSASAYQGYLEGEFVNIGSSQGGQLEHLAVARGQRVELGAPTRCRHATRLPIRAESALAIASRQYQLGAISQSALLDAQRQQLQTSIERIQALSDRYADTAALLQALGGADWRAVAKDGS